MPVKVNLKIPEDLEKILAHCIRWNRTRQVNLLQ